MTTHTPATVLARDLTDLPQGDIAVAVSGGSDSLGLLHLTADWAQDLTQTKRKLYAVTVDHGLRPAARDEAGFVGQQAKALGLSHTVLNWHWDGQGNLMDQARRGRYQVMADWARAQGIGTILLGHTSDDQAETFVMRLGRGAGVDGLAAMAPRFDVDGVTFRRPVLALSRAALRDCLTTRSVTWVEDPSNDDPRFDRVRIRQNLGALDPLGVTPARLSDTAQAMAEAKKALNWALSQWAGDHVTQIAGDLAIASDGFAQLPREMQRRLMVATLRWISGADYAPRAEALDHLLDQALAAQPATLHGVRMTHRQGAIYLFREFRAVAQTSATFGAVFDHRWHLHAQPSAGQAGAENPENLTLAPLGEAGLKHCDTWRESGRPAAAHWADPAIWRDNQLISAPLAGYLQGFRADLAPKTSDFCKWLLGR